MKPQVWAQVGLSSAIFFVILYFLNTRYLVHQEIRSIAAAAVFLGIAKVILRVRAGKSSAELSNQEMLVLGLLGTALWLGVGIGDFIGSTHSAWTLVVGGVGVAVYALFSGTWPRR